MDQWNLADASDRRQRRLMDKDNKKAREDARRDYNDTIRSLAKFARKRDPRYKAHLAREPSCSSTPVEVFSQRQTQVTETYVEQDWQKVSVNGEDADLDWAVAEDDSEEWECVVCGKTFRSEPAWDSHERSKKHIKEVERLRREMEVEDEVLGLQVGDRTGELDEEDLRETDKSPGPIPSVENDLRHSDHGKTDSESVHSNNDKIKVADDDPEQNAFQRKQRKSNKNGRERPIEPLTKTEKRLQDMQVKGSMAFLQTVTEAGAGNMDVPQNDGVATNNYTANGPNDHATASNVKGPEPELSKREKRRLREAQKAPQNVGGDVHQRCNVCGQPFESKTKLFAHIKDTGHALACPDYEGKDRKRVAKGKKR